MHRRLILLLCTVAACTATPEPGPTTSTIPTVTTSSSSAGTTVPGTTSTTVPAEATTSAATTSTLALDETVLAYQTVADLAFPVQLTARPGEPQSYVITKNGLV